MRIETVADINKAIDEFLERLNIFENAQVNCSDAWFPFPEYISEKDTLQHLGGVSGIYVFSEPDKENPLIPMRLNTNKIWYIGKS